MKTFIDNNGWWITFILGSILCAFSINFSSIGKWNYILAGTFFIIGFILSSIFAFKHFIKVRFTSIENRIARIEADIRNPNDINTTFNEHLVIDGPHAYKVNGTSKDGPYCPYCAQKNHVWIKLCGNYCSVCKTSYH